MHEVVAEDLVTGVLEVRMAKAQAHLMARVTTVAGQATRGVNVGRHKVLDVVKETVASLRQPRPSSQAHAIIAVSLAIRRSSVGPQEGVQPSLPLQVIRKVGRKEVIRKEAKDEVKVRVPAA